MAKAQHQEIGPEKKTERTQKMKSETKEQLDALRQSSLVRGLDLAARPFQPSEEWKSEHPNENEQKERIPILNDSREARFELLKEIQFA